MFLFQNGNELHHLVFSERGRWVRNVVGLLVIPRHLDRN